MFERFTDKARRLVVRAQDHARNNRNESIQPEHILRAMLDLEDPVADILKDAGITEEKIDALIEPFAKMAPLQYSGHIPFTPATKKILELGLREALQLGHNYISPMHLLLGLVRLKGNDDLSNDLAALLPDDLRGTVIEVFNQINESDPEAPIPPPLKVPRDLALEALWYFSGGELWFPTERMNDAAMTLVRRLLTIARKPSDETIEMPYDLARKFSQLCRACVDTEIKTFEGFDEFKAIVDEASQL